MRLGEGFDYKFRSLHILTTKIATRFHGQPAACTACLPIAWLPAVISPRLAVDYEPGGHLRSGPINVAG